jgi:transposase
MRRQPLNDEEWSKIQHLMPSNDGRGRNYRNHREVVGGIIWAMRSGARWRDIPEEQFAPWTTVYSRYRNWVQSGFWKELFQRLNGLRQRVDHLDWSANFVDGTTIPVHHKATGGSPFSEAIGISRGGLTTKVHVRIDREGHLLNVEVTEGQRQELAVYKTLMNNGAVKNPWGRPKLRPEAVVGDKGYNAGWAHDWNHRKHMASVIPKYDSPTRKGPFQKDLYRERNLVERTIGHLKEFRRVAFRVEKLAEHYEANWLIAEIVRSLSDIDQPL